jgi:hypothetical protein
VAVRFQCHQVRVGTVQRGLQLPAVAYLDDSGAAAFVVAEIAVLDHPGPALELCPQRAFKHLGLGLHVGILVPQGQFPDTDDHAERDRASSWVTRSHSSILTGPGQPKSAGVISNV